MSTSHSELFSEPCPAWKRPLSQLPSCKPVYEVCQSTSPDEVSGHWNIIITFVFIVFIFVVIVLLLFLFVAVFIVVVGSLLTIFVFGYIACCSFHCCSSPCAHSWWNIPHPPIGPLPPLVGTLTDDWLEHTLSHRCTPPTTRCHSPSPTPPPCHQHAGTAVHERAVHDNAKL